MCRAAQALEIPDLKKLATERLEIALDSVVYDSLIEGVCWGHSKKEKVQQLMEDRMDELAKTYKSGFARKEIVKICCEYFTYLQEDDEFLRFTDAHPEFLRKMLSYAAQH